MLTEVEMKAFCCLSLGILHVMLCIVLLRSAMS